MPFLCEPRLADLREGKRERVKHGGQILDDRGLREETLRRVRPEGLRVVGRHGDKSGVHEPPDTKRRENRFRKLNRVSGDPAAKRYRNALLIKRKGECREELAPALAAGDTVVIKPASDTPLSILELAKLLKDILPAGVVNVLPGSGRVAGQAILEHPGFAKLAFTGSTEVGRNVGLAAAKRIIPATLELGGKSANIIFDDCNFDKALEGAQMGILFNQGQVCCAGSRILVQDTIYDKFIAALKKEFEAVKVGRPWEEGVQVGALVDERQLKKVLSYVDIGKEEGATVITGGRRLTEDGLDKGCFMAPTLLGDVTPDMRVAQEEIFGPVAVVIKFHTEEEALAIANDSVYGLGGAVWTQDINRAIRVARGVHTGRMWVNTYNELPAHAPFGGYKQSGIGRETYLSILSAYTQTKNIFISLNEKRMGMF